MKTQKYNSNRNKSQNKNLLNKNFFINKSTSIANHNQNKTKKIKTNSVGNSIRQKSKQKKPKNNIFQEKIFERNSNNFCIDFNNYQQYNYNNYNKDIDNNFNKNELKQKIIYDNNSLFNDPNNNSYNNLYKSKNNQNINNGFIENSNIFKITLDRLMSTSYNLLEKQNNILTECDILAKNVAMNDYAIQTINKTEIERKFNFKEILDNHTYSINTLFSKLKKNKTNFEINEELKKENNILKNKLEMMNISQEDNIKLKDSEISTLKIVLVSEINHILSFLEEIGYDKIPINKMEISDVTSQKITNFFELILKIIKQMKELIQKNEEIISKMKIEQNIIIDNKNENINNKSFERMSLDYRSSNNVFKNYNFSFNNSNQKKKFNISFRNNSIINKNFKNTSVESSYKNNNIQINNDFNNNKKNGMKNNEYTSNQNSEFGINNKIDNNDKYKINSEENKDNHMNTDSYFYNKEKQDINYSYDKGSNKSFQTGTFILKENESKNKEYENK